MKIGLISDPHAIARPVEEALALFEREGVDVILCAGDIGGYGNQLDETVELLIKYQVMAVRGNHEEWALQRKVFPGSDGSREYFECLPEFLSLEYEGVSLYMVHAEPPDKVSKGLRLFDQHGELMPEVMAEWEERLEGFDYQVLILGHTHQVYDAKVAGTLVINPGSSCFNHSCAILELPEMQVEWFALGGSSIDKVWNWGSNEVTRS